MPIDRVSRKKNREQDARLDDLTKLVDGLDDDLHDEYGVLDRIVNLTTRANQTDDSIGEIDRDIALLTQRVAALEAAQEPPPPPPPTEKWTLLTDLSRVSAWDGVLNSAPGSTIKDTPEGIDIYQPNKGERCELQLNDDRLTEGVTARYSWDLFIDPSTQLDPTGSGTDTISQQHGNNQSGYGGGLTIRASDHMVILRVKGGKRLSASGSQRYEYESDGKGASPPEPASKIECGKVTFGQVHRIIYECKWAKNWTGYARVSINGAPFVGVSNVPTMCEPADVELFRVGWYSSDGPVPKRMTVRGCKVEVRA